MAGIYIHIPFCKQACTYCNFHFSTSLSQKTSVINAIVHEISLTKPYDSKEVIDTIYLGGGTPSLLSVDELSTITTTINKKFIVSPGAEITLEANPDNINGLSVKQWMTLGINRLSVGIQSFNETELKWMNRAHSAHESFQCIEAILNAGIINFSVDLIYGSHLQSDSDLKKNIDIIISKNIPHISCYALTVEPKTALDIMIRKDQSLQVDNDKQSRQFLLLMQWLRDAGYEHYEISNFAKPGMRSRHNSSYWQGKTYYGFGPSAHSFNGNNIRKWNIANNALYIKSLENNLVPFTEELLTTPQQLNEYIMISLRTKEGIDLEKIKNSFGQEYKDELLFHSKRYLDSENMQLKNDFLTLTDNGKLLADGIAAGLFTDAGSS